MKLIKENNKILPALSRVSGIPEARLKKRGTHNVSSWVNLGAYYAREVEGQTLAAIGEIFNRSFASAYLSCRKVKEALDDPKFKDDIEAGLKELQAEVAKLEREDETTLS